MPMGKLTIWFPSFSLPLLLISHRITSCLLIKIIFFDILYVCVLCFPKHCRLRGAYNSKGLLSASGKQCIVTNKLQGSETKEPLLSIHLCFHTIETTYNHGCLTSFSESELEQCLGTCYQKNQTTYLALVYHPGPLIYHKLPDSPFH